MKKKQQFNQGNSAGTKGIEITSLFLLIYNGVLT